MMKSLFRSLCLTAVTLASPSAWATPEISVDSAVTAAWHNNPTILKHRERLTEEDARISTAISHVFPSLGLAILADERKAAVDGSSSPWSMSTPNFGGEPFNYYNVEFQLIQPIYQGGALWAAIRAAKKERAASEFELEIAKRDLAIQVIEAFYSTLLIQRHIETLRRSEALEKELLTTAKTRYRIGTGGRFELLQIQTQLALLKPKISELENRIRAKTRELANLLGDTESRELHLKGSLDSLSPERVDSWLKKVAANPPELKRLEVIQEELSDQADLLLSKHWPRVDFVGRWGRSSFTRQDLLGDYGTSWNFGVQVAIPLFSGLSSFSERREAASKSAQLELERRDVRDRFSLDQIRGSDALELAKHNLESMTEAYGLAQKARDEGSREYRLSLAPLDYIRFLTGQQSFLDAEIALDDAKYGLVSALGEYFRSFGLSMEELTVFLGGK